MKQVSFDSVSNIYDCARLVEFQVHLVDDEKFQAFCLSLRNFERSLGELASDDYWRPFLRTLKRYRFDVSSTPLHFNYPLDHSPDFVNRLKEKLVSCGLIYPQHGESAHELVNFFLALVDSCSNPIIDTCANIPHSGNADTAMLIKESRLIPAVERRLSNVPKLGEVEVISSSQLKGHHFYSNLMVIGPIRWYDEYVFQSPRARHMHIVKYRWMNDISPSTEVFAGSLGSSGAVWVGNNSVTRAGAEENSNSPSNSFEPDDFLPPLDWDDVLRRISPRIAGESEREDEGEEYVTARLFQLEGSQVVALDASDSARATILLLSEEEDPVQRMPVVNIVPGMFLLVRAGGGGEYIPHVADQILREHSSRVREIQRDWKDRLRRKVRIDGYAKVVDSLKSYGSKRANDVNLRNWMSYRTIKTNDPIDFRAIMRFIGLRDDFTSYWNAMHQIDSAHRRAGQLIRRQLLAQVRNADLRDLEKLGTMDFEVPGVEGGNLTAIRIQSMHSQTLEIEVAKIGQPFEMDGDSWLG